MLELPTTTRAYTLKLTCKDSPDKGEEFKIQSENTWQELLWSTHCVVNRGAYIWGNWLLTLRGGLPASLADDETILPITDVIVNKELKKRKLASSPESVGEFWLRKPSEVVI